MSVKPKTLDMAAIWPTRPTGWWCVRRRRCRQDHHRGRDGAAAAEYGRTVCVLTIDPAKRLAQRWASTTSATLRNGSH